MRKVYSRANLFEFLSLGKVGERESQRCTEEGERRDRNVQEGGASRRV